MWVAGIIFFFIGFIGYICCVAAGRNDEASERYYNEHYEKDN